MEGKKLEESMEGSDEKPPQTMEDWWEEDDTTMMMVESSFSGYISQSLAMSDSCEVLDTRQKQVHQDPFNWNPFPYILPQLQLQQDPFSWTPIPDKEQQLQVHKLPSSWTLELQRRFLDAVNALGGPDRAKPEAIWTLMDGSSDLPLSVVRVKLQLQIYRRRRVTALSNEISRRNYSLSVMVRDIKRRIRSLVEHSCYSPNENFVCVISCGGNEQDTKETVFIDDVLNELQNLAVIALRYDLVTTDTRTMFRRLKALYGVFILVFSEGYTSPQSLDRLVILMEYKKANGLLVIPVFNNVTVVRDPKAFIEETFLKLDTSVHAERVQKWREAIIEFALTNDFKWIGGTEFILPKEIARYACLRLYSISSNNVTGMYSLLNTWPLTDIQIIGIWGMPGVGKTTVAGEIFRRLAPGYDSCYFLQDFHLMYQTKGLSHLRDEFFSKLYGEEKLVIDACDTNPSFLKDRFRSKSVLVVIDDVSNARDAEALVGGFDWFSCGHLVIFTSRNKQVLVQCKVKKLYQIQKLSESESSQFLSLCVPGQYEPMLNAELVRYASGIPLVLSVLGSCVTNQCTFSEKEQLKTLRQNPPTEIQDAFRRSFDGLNENEKNIFLDLASFFRWENRNHVIQILDGCGYFTELGICGLLDESLIDPIGNRIEMSNVVQDMGRFVVCEESKEPGKRSRLWDANEIVEVLTNSSGTEAVEGIILDMSNLTCELSPTIFERTYRLRLLKLHCSISGNRCNLCLPRGLDSLPDELRLLHWESYPLRSLPRNFNPKNLVELNMPYSKMEKLWRGTKNLEKLRKIRLSHSRQLTKIPRLSKALNLEHIDLEGCTSLVKIISSIQHLDKLVSLNLRDCSRLQTMPVMIHLESLEVLNLSGCLDLKDIQDFSPNLKELYLAGTAVSNIPSSIENLTRLVTFTRLVTLDLENCSQLLHLPQGISNLRNMVTLKLSGCLKLKSLPDLDATIVRCSESLNTEITTMEVPEPLVHHSAIQESRWNDCETHDKLQLRPEILDSCLDNSAIQESVAAFVPHIGEIRQHYWPWSIITLQPLSILHFLASRLYALVSLFLSNACLVDIPKEICEIPTVNALDIGGNGFRTIPESIRLLPKLHSLSLRHCKSLKSLPELPQSLKLLNVHGCVSLKSVPWCFERLLMHCTFSNCFSLSPEAFRIFLAKALGIVKFKNMKREQDQKLSTETAFSICGPASQGLKSSTDVFASQGLKSSVQNGSSVVIRLTSSLRKAFLGFTMSVVVSFRDNYYNVAGFSIRCTCIMKRKSGLSNRLEKVFHFWAPKEASKIKKDHIFVFYDAVILIPSDAREGNNPYMFDELVKFEFRPVDSQNEVLDDSCKVKTCGVCVITDESGDTSLVKTRFSPIKRERSGKKLLASSIDTGGFSSGWEPMPRSKRGRYRRSVESAFLKMRKRKREESFSTSNQSSSGTLANVSKEQEK
ncbi:unnamed protein product [Microthlaspi erraticum]|uniref:Uncharacterized protein n=1 Tax=Microthlaspi erraticum TaxID=1685480 RepID=A0A6D2KYM4_9BRAS|nr:unnamed protein product [Microthlaspi erraticum]